MLITNENRKRQINNFIDEDHGVMSDFYDIMDSDISSDRLLKKMRKLIDKDADFYDPYLVVAEILFCEDKEKEGITILQNAYERAVKRIVDYKGRWPKEMAWGFLENRHLMRTIEQYAILCWEIDKINEALDIFRNLLRMNSNDNQGARYNILAIKLGLGIDEWEKPFEVIHDGKIVGLDSIKVSNWFNENAPKFPEEFQWLIDLHERAE